VHAALRHFDYLFRDQARRRIMSALYKPEFVTGTIESQRHLVDRLGVKSPSRKKPSDRHDTVPNMVPAKRFKLMRKLRQFCRLPDGLWITSRHEIKLTVQRCCRERQSGCLFFSRRRGMEDECRQGCAAALHAWESNRLLIRVR
jgi:hypothetical protein